LPFPNENFGIAKVGNVNDGVLGKAGFGFATGFCATTGAGVFSTSAGVTGCTATGGVGITGCGFSATIFGWAWVCPISPALYVVTEKIGSTGVSVTGLTSGVPMTLPSEPLR
jgi:hypothetical protein